MKGAFFMPNEYLIYIVLGAIALIIIIVFLIQDISSNRSADANGVDSGGYRARNQYMQMAIDEARFGIHNGHGGPFGAVIIKNGKVVGKGHNCVILENDSTCHGEIVAIRNAEKTLGTYDLSGCELYTTGEPCQMCLAACKWANIEHVYYGCTIDDNSAIGFRDGEMDRLLGNRRAVEDYLEQVDRHACLELFKEYSRLDKTIY